MRKESCLAGVAALVLAAALPAQLAPGDRLDPPELEGFTQTAAKSASDLTGRAVLYEFFAFW
jgi:hypothetical protein